MNQTEPSQLRVKSYFVSSVPDAIQAAKMDLGPDALLLKSRPTPPEYAHLGSLEVVFGIPAEMPQLKVTPAILPPASARVEDVLQRLESIHQILLRSPEDDSSKPRAADFVERLLSGHGIPADISHEIAIAVAERMSPRTVEISGIERRLESSSGALRRELTAELSTRISVRNQLGRVSALVGPAGTGKTTTLVKLAVAEGLIKRRPVKLISTDSERIGAAEQLQSFASIIGVAFEAVATPTQLSTAIAHTSDTFRILIDTPGYSPALFEQQAHDWADAFERQHIDTQLVLSATMRQKSIDAAVKRFQPFQPSGLIFTHLDEAEGMQVAAVEALRHQLPLSWLCAGQMIPEDIALADTEQLVAALVTDMPLAMRPAA